MATNQIEGELPYPDHDKGPGILQVLWILGAISIIVVILRIYTKIVKTRRLYWDDTLMVLAVVLGIIYAATTTVAIHYGLGRHYLYLGPQDRSESLRWGVLTIAWGILSPMVARVSFCVTLLFLAGTDPDAKKWPIWTFIVVQLLVNVASVIAFYAQCGTHLSIYWTISPSQAQLLPQYCWDPVVQTKLGYFAGAINCLTDAFLTVLPAVLIEHTKLSLKKKIGLGSLLCLSILALVASIVKTYAVKALSQVTDYTYDLAYYVVWISVEMNVVITVTSIPLIRPLFKRKKPPIIEPSREQKWDNDAMSLNYSAFSRKGISRVVPASISSQENIMPHPRHPYYEMDESPGITVTREVTVTYQSENVPFVHASLVGLVQGEVANPQLARRRSVHT